MPVRSLRAHFSQLHPPCQRTIAFNCIGVAAASLLANAWSLLAMPIFTSHGPHHGHLFHKSCPCILKRAPAMVLITGAWWRTPAPTTIRIALFPLSGRGKLSKPFTLHFKSCCQAKSCSWARLILIPRWSSSANSASLTASVRIASSKAFPIKFTT